jgi:polygalacturonase
MTKVNTKKADKYQNIKKVFIVLTACMNVRCQAIKFQQTK